MSQYLVTYDVQRANPDPHSKILEHAAKFGWYSFARDVQDKFAILPNTTLVGNFIDLASAQERFYTLVDYARGQNFWDSLP